MAPSPLVPTPIPAYTITHNGIACTIISTYIAITINRGVGREGSKGSDEPPFKPGFNNS